MTIDHPLRLAVGSHQAGSGKGCAMNVISWESGDTTITDFPACADPMLARIVQGVNDTIPNVCNSLPAAAFCTAWEPCEPQCMTHVNGAIIQRIERTDEPYRDGE